MTVKAISELTATYLSTLNGIGNITGDYYIECSIKNDNTVYESYKLDLKAFCKDLIDHLGYISSQCNIISGNAKEISSNYVKKSGDTMTGTLSFKENDNDSSPVTLNIQSNGEISSKYSSHKFGDNVFITKGLLECKQDIKGCALSAKWC